MERRNTIQRNLVLNAVQKLGNHATADEIYAFISKEHPNIGKGTVYRNLNILAEEGQIGKVEILDGPVRFDHIKTPHYHVECIKCGKIFDVDMDIVEGLQNKIHDTHGFEFLDYEILFSGICPKCREDK